MATKPIRRKVTVTMTDSKKNEYPVDFTVADAWSAFQLWLKEEGNTGKTQQDYIDYLKGLEGESLTEIKTTQEIVKD